MPIRALVKEFTPPIVWRLARFVKQEALRGKVILASGNEMAPGWYDSNISESYYYPYYKSHYYPLWTVVLDRIIRNKDCSILEVGCGTGQFASMLSENGISSYCGFDFSYKRIEQAKKINSNISFVVADAFVTDLFETYTYNSIVCMEVLEHIDDDIGLISRVPFGKRFYGTVPNFPEVNHVRHFSSTDDVVERYKEYFADFSVTKVRIDDSMFFVFEGVTI